MLRNNMELALKMRLLESRRYKHRADRQQNFRENKGE